MSTTTRARSTTALKASRSTPNHTRSTIGDHDNTTTTTTARPRSSTVHRSPSLLGRPRRRSKQEQVCLLLASFFVLSFCQRLVHSQQQPQVSIAEGPDLVCVSWDPSQGQCRVQACRNHNHSSAAPPHYGHGRVHRPPSARAQTHGVRVGGQAQAGSGCAISHKYRFLYIHVLKSGGMSLKAWLKQALCGNSTQMPCQTGPEYLQIVSCRSALDQHPHYFVWSFVRNPYSRMYSTYAMARAYNRRKHPSNPTTTTLPPFDFSHYVFASKPTPAVKRQLLMEPSHHRNRTNRQAQFTLQELLQRYDQHRAKALLSNHTDIDKSAWSVPSSPCQARKALTYMSTVHCQPQSHFLLDAHDCPVFDWLGRLERLEQDLPRLLSILNSPELDRASSLLARQTSTAFGQQRLAGSNLQQVYDPQLQQAVANEYEPDFRLFGYNPQVVPRQ